MMNLSQTQKKVLEWPLLLFVIWISQALEISLFSWEGMSNLFHWIPVLMTYLAITRDWGLLVALTLLLAFFASSTVSTPWPLYVSIHLWVVLILKLVMMTFSLEGRKSFTQLAALGNLMAQALGYLFLEFFGHSFPLIYFFKQTVLTTLSSTLLAWLLFPIFAQWDEFFEHSYEEARELRPGALK